MTHAINRVTVIGAGTMGAAIAGHLANAGIPAFLLDIVPNELTPDEAAKGLTLDHPAVRNRFVNDGMARMVKAKPNNLFSPENAKLITLGNLEDDFDTAVSQSDWIVEVIIERPGPKQALMERIEQTAPAHAIVSSNTSGIPIHIIAQGRSDDFKKRFLGTHFFNPPRYLHLLEIIPTPDTDPAIVAQMRTFAEQRLGKGVVVCKDTPNFVGNRMFSFIMSDLMEFVIENGYTVEEVDKLTGTLLGRPKSATFRLLDVVGIDVMALVSGNLYDLIPQDEDRDVLRSEYQSAVVQTLVDNKLFGAKVGQGFWKTVKTDKGKKEFWGLDLPAAAEGEIEYVAPAKPKWSSVGDAKDKPLPDRLRTLAKADDAAGDLIWHTLSRTMAYASKRIPEIADSLVDIDNAMKWGFGWEMGPFEMWDVLGAKNVVARLEGEGGKVAPWVKEMLAKDVVTFYAFENGAKLAYSPLTGQYEPIDASPLDKRVADVRRNKSNTIAENDSAGLLDMGDGVMLLEFRSKMNALDSDIFALMRMAVERMHGNASGLVIANDGANFCVGVNLLKVGLAAQGGLWKEVEAVSVEGQQTILSLRQAPKPVVAAPFNMALGGGAEVSMGSDRIVAHAEAYIGLVEFGVGLIPGWGGCKELVRRRVSPHMTAPNVNPTPYLQQVFEQIGFAKVSESAVQAREMEILGPNDRIVMNRDHLLMEAKREVLSMVADGYSAAITKGNVYASGKDQLANLRIGIYTLQQGGYISEYDAHIAGKLAHILTGGELSAPAWMDEQYFLDLEREAILSLLGEEKTHERIWHMLQTGKPLRN
ncbi:MAG: enoyl-CoA hydratase/isomerase family protein [Caldilineaceae bacterium]|nr:enoyl-CoA hydratase/isomerase family protein [Caldilineaceae bacterium]MBP8107015.1 enoyl-CoA hydratase/isomerase family protein [Caldilineaceae bacterium]MBP8121991.1 enoyl-CoA hydratase/isomerase family protein [Caldilineaceae bacterium]MBP9072644.1 enoyl-CoA hydratase/isomerase family protein [Caldilineaceae bacterium]